MKVIETIGLTLVGVTLTMVGDVFLKRSNGWHHPSCLGLGLLFYTVGCVPVAFIFRRVQFTEVFILWEAMTIILATVVSRVLFGEAISKSNVAALVLAFGAMLLSVR